MTPVRTSREPLEEPAVVVSVFTVSPVFVTAVPQIAVPASGPPTAEPPP